MTTGASDTSRCDALVQAVVDAGFLTCALAIRQPDGKIVSTLAGEPPHVDADDALDIPFMAGSQAKIVVATAILELVARQQLSLNDTAADFIEMPGLRLAKITIGELLAHRSGLRDYLPALLEDWKSRPRAGYSKTDLLRAAAKPGFGEPSHGSFRYSNTSYVVLAMIAETVTGIALPDLLKKLVFAPYGLQVAYSACEGISPRRKLGRGFLVLPDVDGPIDMSTLDDLSFAAGAGDLIWTLADALIFSTGLVSKTGSGLAAMTRSPNIVGSRGDWLKADCYGYGIEGFDIGSRRVWGHRGFIWGTASATFVDPGERRVVAGFATHAGRLDGRIADEGRCALRNLFLAPFTYGRCE